MNLNVIVNGAKGKMGSEACLAIGAHPELTLVAALGREDNLGAAIKLHAVDVVVDLTRADCAYQNALTIIEAGVHPVIGTSGLTASDIETLAKQCEAQQLGGLIVPNFSVGAVLMMYFSKIAARFMRDVEIIEIHHQQKVDAPSQTALKTAEMIKSVTATRGKRTNLQESIPGVLGGTYHDIPIHSLRLPGYIANQQVIFGQHGETLTITHNSVDRASFMPGVILACREVTKLKHLVYGLEQVLNLD